MAEKKKTTGTKKPRNTKKAPQVITRVSTAPAKTRQNSGFGREIGILIVALIAIFLFLGAINVAGPAGEFINECEMGWFGLLGYVFPFLFAFVGIFLIARCNMDGIFAVFRMLGVIIMYLALDGIFYICGGADGGSVGKAIAGIFDFAGSVGGFFILLFIILICFFPVTGISVVELFRSAGSRVGERVREQREYNEETRDLRSRERELRAQERVIRKKEQYEEKINERKRRIDHKVSGVALGSTAIGGQSANAAAEVPFDEGIPEAKKPVQQEFTYENGLTIHRHDAPADEKQPEKPAESSPAKAPSGPIFAARDLRTDAELDSLDNKGLHLDADDWAPDDKLFESAPYTQPGVSEKKPAEEAPAAGTWIDALTQQEENQKTAPAASTAPFEESIWGDYSINKEGSQGAVFSSGKPKSIPKPRIRKNYKLPPVSLLSKGEKGSGVSNSTLKETASMMENTLREYGVGATVTDITCGPAVTRYELHPDQGVRINKIVSLTNEIKMALAATNIRIEAPIPGKSAVGIEVPNKESTAVRLRELVESPEFKNHKSKIAFCAGRDIAGTAVIADIAKMPHLLIAGATGSGKSVCINSIIISILFRATPDEVQFLMIDPKQVELANYQGIPHLMAPVVTDTKKAAAALNYGVSEMEKRYKMFAARGVRDISSYNEKVPSLQEEYDAMEEHDPGDERPEKLPQIVIIVDEMADLMMVAPHEIEDAICRIAQLARAAGIHLIIATQRPSVNVITGLIKANVPSRIAFAVSSSIDSRVVIDMPGAERLIGRGDMLYFPQGMQAPLRAQGTWVTDEEIESVVEYWKNQRDEFTTVRQQTLEKQLKSAVTSGMDAAVNDDDDDTDDLFAQCGRFIIENDKASIGNLQRKFKIGFNRAARIMDQLCDAGVVGPDEGKKPRQILMTVEEFNELIGE